VVALSGEEAGAAAAARDKRRECSCSLHLCSAIDAACAACLQGKRSWTQNSRWQRSLQPTRLQRARTALASRFASTGCRIDATLATPAGIATSGRRRAAAAAAAAPRAVQEARPVVAVQAPGQGLVLVAAAAAADLEAARSHAA
jgi:hypothetical protein